MKVTVHVIVVRDDGTTLTREERAANDQPWVGARRRRLTRAELRKAIDARVAAALNSTMGARR